MRQMTGSVSVASDLGQDAGQFRRKRQAESNQTGQRQSDKQHHNKRCGTDRVLKDRVGRTMKHCLDLGEHGGRFLVLVGPFVEGVS